MYIHHILTHYYTYVRVNLKIYLFDVYMVVRIFLPPLETIYLLGILKFELIPANSRLIFWHTVQPRCVVVGGDRQKTWSYVPSLLTKQCTVFPRLDAGLRLNAGGMSATDA